MEASTNTDKAKKTNGASILLIGATGAIGREVLHLVLQDDTYERVVILTRRAIPALEGHDKVEEHIIDFETLFDEDKRAAYASAFQVRDVFCGLGSTRSKAGSKARFARIDHDYPLEVGKLAKAAGASRYILISSVGATPKTWNHYLKTKGRLEAGLTSLDFESLQILRPSLLLGEREEERFGEDVGQFLDKYMGFLIPKRYKGIHVKEIARRVLDIGQKAPEGLHIWESESIALDGST